MAAPDDSKEKYERPPAVGLQLGVTTNAVYALLQKGLLKGVCENGKWYVEVASVRRYKATRERETRTTQAVLATG